MYLHRKFVSTAFSRFDPLLQVHRIETNTALADFPPADLRPILVDPIDTVAYKLRRLLGIQQSGRRSVDESCFNLLFDHRANDCSQLLYSELHQHPRVSFAKNLFRLADDPSDSGCSKPPTARTYHRALALSGMNCRESRHTPQATRSGYE